MRSLGLFLFYHFHDHPEGSCPHGWAVLALTSALASRALYSWHNSTCSYSLAFLLKAREHNLSVFYALACPTRHPTFSLSMVFVERASQAVNPSLVTVGGGGYCRSSRHSRWKCTHIIASTLCCCIRSRYLTYSLRNGLLLLLTNGRGVRRTKLVRARHDSRLWRVFVTVLSSSQPSYSNARATCAPARTAAGMLSWRNSIWGCSWIWGLSCATICPWIILCLLLTVVVKVIE